MQLAFSLGVCLFGLLGFYGVTGQSLTQTQHLGLTQNASVLCSKNGTLYCLMFDLNANADTIDLVFTRNHSDATLNSVGTFDSAGNGIIVDMSTGSARYWLTVCWTWVPTTLTAEAMAGLAYIDPVDSNVVSIDIMAKAIWDAAYMDMITFPEDVLWVASCNTSEIQDNVLVTGAIDVTGSIVETPTVVTISAQLIAVDALLDVDATVFTLGQSMFLRVILTPPAPGSSIAATGMFVYDCWICDVSDCSGVNTKPLIGVDGCPILPTYFSQFRPVGLNAQMDPFPAVQLNNQPQLYFRCYAGPCFDVSDPRCLDFCAFSTGKRKRRQASEIDDLTGEPQTVVAQITITTGPTGRPTVNVEHPDGPAVTAAPAHEETQTVGLIAAVITLAGLLLVGLIVAVAVFFRLSSRNHVNEKA